MTTRTSFTPTQANFLHWPLHYEAKVRTWLRRRSLKFAIERAYRQFARQHYQWKEFLFDRHFLTHDAMPLLAACVERNTLPAPAELVALWKSQFGQPFQVSLWPSLKEATLVAADFLAYLEVELSRQQQLTNE